MKTLTSAVFILLCLRVAQTALTEAQIAATSKLIRRTCNSKAKVELEVLDAMRRGNFENTDKNVKCYLNCCLVMMKIVEKSGHVDIEASAKQIMSLPEPRRPMLTQTMEICKDVGRELTDKCDAAYELSKCMYNSDAKGYLVP